MVIFIVNHKIKDEYCLSKWLCLLCIRYVGLRWPGVIYRHLVRIWSWSIIENAVSLTLDQFHSLEFSFTYFSSVSLTLDQFHSLWIRLVHFGSGLLTLDQVCSLWIRLAHFGCIWLTLDAFGSLCISLIHLDQYG